MNPSFFLVGNSKSGTSTLVAMLRQHPDLFVCRPSEPNHFATDLQHPGSVAFRPRSEEEYLALFAPAEPTQRGGDASGSYLFSHEAAQGISTFAPEARLVAVFREPVSFLHSYHLQLLRNPVSEGERVPDLAAALALEAERAAGRSVPRGCVVPQLLRYRDRVRYTEHLERFDQRFPAKALLVLLYDDLAEDPVAVARQVYRFLGVDADVPLAAGHQNPGRRMRAPGLVHGFNRTASGEGGRISRAVAGVGRRVLPATARQRAAHLVNHRLLVRQPAPVDPALAEQLRQELRPEVVALGERLGVDLVGRWGYPR